MARYLTLYLLQHFPLCPQTLTLFDTPGKAANSKHVLAMYDFVHPATFMPLRSLSQKQTLHAAAQCVVNDLLLSCVIFGSRLTATGRLSLICFLPRDFPRAPRLLLSCDTQSHTYTPMPPQG
jgi:hypothetical protein